MLIHWGCALGATFLLAHSFGPTILAQPEPQQQQRSRRATPNTSSALTPLQQEIERERRRLSSSDKEERRDAVMRLGWMKRPESSRAAAVALGDSSPIVRATATRAVLSLPPDEAAALLLPLLADKDEFVRQEAAYALGPTRSRNAIQPLVALLLNDKQSGVRGAAAVSLGQIGDESAAAPLAKSLDRRIKGTGFLSRIRRSTSPENEFVRRAAAVSLGQIGSRVAVPALVSTLADEKVEDDVRREAARALGLIGDPSAVPALKNVLTSRDPYLSRLAFEALKKIAPSEAMRPT
ncbi:MAG TPA: HEAT repeat domain-containing protein [Pyrinomonadaceae bacterium]|nr:HEAT repeat domain-containing protein [Pyrinomonadaceae bacterium]